MVEVFTAILMVLLLLTALFLILLVLIQRGKGGGLSGALGGMGGQSAFGTKAGDLFTRITIGVAAFWIILCMVTVKFFGVSQTSMFTSGGNQPAQSTPAPAEPQSGSSTAPGPSAPVTPEKGS